MKHRILTCKYHPELRWTTKEIAWSVKDEVSGDGYYNGSRNIFFIGTPSGEVMYRDGSGLHCLKVKDEKIIEECSCPSSCLIIAPEDKLVR